MDKLNIQTVVGGPVDVNTYVVGLEGSDQCVIIDPGAEPERVDAVVCDRKVCAVLLTHGHYDHLFYAAPWLGLGAKLYIHELDAPALQDAAINLSSMMRVPVTLPDADVLLHEGDKVCEAGLEMIVLHTPGHTRGSVCYQCGNVLFSGDTLFYGSYGRIDFPGGSGRDMYTSLMRLMELDADMTAYPGHGIKTKIAWERGNYV